MTRSLARIRMYGIVVMQKGLMFCRIMSMLNWNKSEKTAAETWKAIEKPAYGIDIPEIFRNGSAEPVVEFGEDGSFHCPGPNSFHY